MPWPCCASIRQYRRLVAMLMIQLVSTLASLYLPTVNAAIVI